MASFDELNNINSFFKTMALSKEEIHKREQIAWELFDLFLFMFEDVKAYIENDVDIPIERLKDETSEKYRDVVTTFYDNALEKYPAIGKYIEYIVGEIVNTTVKNVKGANKPPSKPIEGNENESGTNYWVSPERAIIVAETETNTIGNRHAYEVAISDGKTTKTWMTMLDDKVREAHQPVHGETLPIDDYFDVGNAKMKYPHDTDGIDVTADLIINCRCVCEYS